MGPRLAMSRNERSRRHSLQNESDTLKQYRLIVSEVGFETLSCALAAHNFRADGFKHERWALNGHGWRSKDGRHG
jgi:hypothetical protein